MACTGNGCTQGGNLYCANQRMRCIDTLKDPCIVCVSDGTDGGNDGGTTGGATGGIPDDGIVVLADRALCGNGERETGEECDDRNTRDFDGCSGDCLLERGRCGDGTVQVLLDEQCEPASHDPRLPYSCGQNCRYASSLCGNGMLNEGEQCDDGPGNSQNPGAHCRTDCGLARCGDGVVDAPFESCDDKNRIGGDGCGKTCIAERGAGNLLTSQLFNFSTTQQQLPLQQSPVGQTWQVLPQAVVPAVADSGPGALMVMAGGAAAGVAFMRRKKT